LEEKRYHSDNTVTIDKMNSQASLDKKLHVHLKTNIIYSIQSSQAGRPLL